MLRPQRLAAFTVAAAMSVTLLGPAPNASADNDLAVATDSARTLVAKTALREAEAAMAGNGRDATMALRDLFLVQNDLPPAERAAAARLDARPTKPMTLDSGNIRVHYDPAEMTGPFTAQDVLDTSVYISELYSNAGYRQPKPDGTTGGSSQTDIYVDELPEGLYGFCTIDDSVTFTKNGPKDAPAYCVVDNDYAGFPENTPMENLQVTVAHEYFHATQFAYDFYEDRWFLEATAAWVEDEAYDDINDNKQYLSSSVMKRFKYSMDRFDDNGVAHYGQWIFFRWLTERFPAKQGALPKLVLEMFKAADSSQGAAKDRYSVQAINIATKKVGLKLDKAFSLFSDANRRSRTVYEEGTENSYPVKKLAGSVKMRKKGQAKKFTNKLNHLTSATYRFQPKKLGKKFRLKLSINGAPKNQGTRAVITLWKSNGNATQRYITVNKKGKAMKWVRFDSATIKAIEVTLVNTSTRYRNCRPLVANNASLYACNGDPVDERKSIALTGTVLKK